MQFVQLGLQQTPIIYVPDYDIKVISEESAQRQAWLDAHMTIHSTLRTWTGISGVDLALVNWDDENEFYQWLDAHANEHQLIRNALGIT